MKNRLVIVFLIFSFLVMNSSICYGAVGDDGVSMDIPVEPNGDDAVGGNLEAPMLSSNLLIVLLGAGMFLNLLLKKLNQNVLNN